MKCPERCGICCVIFTHIGLTTKEVISGRYHTRWGGKNTAKEDKWTRFLARKTAFVPEAGINVKVCIYYDERKRICTIYKSRPEVCRIFHCSNWGDEWGKIIEKYKQGTNGLIFSD